MSFILDASVALAWCLGDEVSQYAAATIDALKQRVALVPTVWVLEVSNGLLTAQRRKRLSADAAREVLGLLAALPIHTQDAAGMESALRLFAVAEQFGLSTYDASYLDLAMQRGLPLATLDERLRKAQARAGVERFKP